MSSLKSRQHTNEELHSLFWGGGGGGMGAAAVHIARRAWMGSCHRE